MKTTFAAAASLLASVASAQYYNQSAPFTLTVFSANETINNTSLFACHEGAAIEGICLGGPQYNATAFTHNTSTSYPVENPSAGATGYLTFWLRGGNFNISEPMSLAYSPASNVAVPLFEPGSEGTLVAFDECGKLNIQDGVDDTVSPPVYTNQTALYRWYICLTQEGYRYQTLSWAVGVAPPQNPSCEKVDVVRTFV